MRKDMNFFLQLQVKKKTTGDDNNTLLYVISGIVAALIVVTLAWNTLSLIISGAQIKSYQNKLNDSEVQAKLTESNDVNSKLGTLTTYDNQITTIVSAVSSREVVTTALLNQISSKLPTEVEFSNINIKSTEIVITGTSTKRTAIAELQHNLKSLGRVQDVFVSNISGEETKLTFTVTCTLKDGE